MATLTYNGETFECVRAITNVPEDASYAGYIHLLDANDKVIHTFDNVTSLSPFALSGCDWTSIVVEALHIAVVAYDGTIHQSSLSCKDLIQKPITEMFSYIISSDNTEVTTALGNTYELKYVGEGVIAMGISPKQNLAHNVDIWVMAPEVDSGVYYRVTEQKYINNEDILEFVLPSNIDDATHVTIRFVYNKQG